MQLFTLPPTANDKPNKYAPLWLRGLVIASDSYRIQPSTDPDVRGKAIDILEGGVVHWTHKDPGGTHVNGWIEYQGTKYE
jgi:hypothetical protein